MIIKNYNKYNEELNWNKLNPFKQNKEYPVYKGNEIDPYGEEDWEEDEDNYFNLKCLNVMGNNKYMSLIDIVLIKQPLLRRKIGTKGDIMFQFNFHGNLRRYIFYIALKNDTFWEIKLYYGNNYIPAFFYNKDEAIKFIKYLSIKHKEELNKIESLGIFNINSLMLNNNDIFLPYGNWR